MPTLPAIADWPRWKCTFPIPSADDSSKPQEYTGKQFSNLRAEDWARIEQWLHPTADGTALVFAAPVNGKTTSGSKYPRCELRELNPDGSLAKWSGKSGFHRLRVSLAFTHLPNDTKAIVGAQIHGPDDDVTVFRLESNQLWITKGDSKFKRIDPNYRLGTRFEAGWDVADGVATAFYNGVEVAKVSCGDGNYFKTPCYVQANPTNSKPANASNFGSVTVYAVTVEHHDKPPVTKPAEPAPLPPIQPPVPTTYLVRHTYDGGRWTATVLD